VKRTERRHARKFVQCQPTSQAILDELGQPIERPSTESLRSGRASLAVLQADEPLRDQARQAVGLDVGDRPAGSCRHVAAGAPRPAQRHREQARPTADPERRFELKAAHAPAPRHLIHERKVWVHSGPAGMCDPTRISVDTSTRLTIWATGASESAAHERRA
jgi:hypothetical protein